MRETESRIVTMAVRGIKMTLKAWQHAAGTRAHAASSRCAVAEPRERSGTNLGMLMRKLAEDRDGAAFTSLVGRVDALLVQVSHN